MMLRLRVAELLEQEEVENQALKREMEEATGPESKAAKTIPRLDGADETKDKEQAKFPRLDLSGSPGASSTGGGLQASPMNAGNNRRVSTYGGVDVYVEDEDGSCIDSYMDDLLSGMEALDDELFEDEKRGPPEVDEAVLEGLDREATVEEVERLMSMNVIEGYQNLTGNEFVLDTSSVLVHLCFTM